MLTVDRLGAWTSLGAAIPAAAAWRAGMSGATHARPDLPSHPYREVVTHPAPRLGGFEGVGRLVRLIDLAFEDAGARPSRADLVLLIAGPQSAAFATADEQLARLVSAVSPTARATWGDRITFVRALERAKGHLASNPRSGAWIVCADSLLDPDRIDAAADAAQLKSADQPAGFMPGEAAVVLRLSMQPSGIGRLAEWSVEPLKGPPGPALARVVTRSRGTMNAGHLHVDVDGTEPRARAWGAAITALSAKSGAPLRQWIPALSFGEAGAAACALSAMLALARRIPGDAVISTFDEAHVGALRVERS